MTSEHDHSAPLRFEMLSEPRFLSAVRALVGELAGRIGFDENQCGKISLAMDEAICNVINHGYERRTDGRIWISVWPLEDPAGIRVVIEDQAKQVEPSTIKSRDLEDIRPGGLGVHLIREIMDEVVYEQRSQGGMRLTMSKRQHTSPESEGSNE